MSPPAASSATPAASSRRAIVIFADRADSPLLRWLKPGFRHCFIAIEIGTCWVIIDPLKGRIAVDLLPQDVGLDPASVYAGLGHRVLRCKAQEAEPSPKMPLLSPLTCVNVVKRLLGVRAFWVQTPFQLFAHLERVGKQTEVDSSS